jgi:hypothetical protein
MIMGNPAAARDPAERRQPYWPWSSPSPRATTSATSGKPKTTQPPERVTRIRDLAAQRQASRAEMDEHPGLMVPGEDPVWGELGDAAPNSRTSGPDAILQPPRPEIMPSARLLQLAAEHDSEPDREAAD